MDPFGDLKLGVVPRSPVVLSVGACMVETPTNKESTR